MQLNDTMHHVAALHNCLYVISIPAFHIIVNSNHFKMSYIFLFIIDLLWVNGINQIILIDLQLVLQDYLYETAFVIVNIRNYHLLIERCKFSNVMSFAIKKKDLTNY